jgi:NADH-quinone oxidoreductase subunit F
MSFSEVKERALAEWKRSADNDLKAVGSDETLAGISSQLSLERRITLERCGRIDPEQILHAIATGTYEGLNKALARSADEVLAELEASKLRARDGAGQFVAKKWSACRVVEGDKKVVVGRMAASAGLSKDAVLLKGNPHAVLEGLLIAAYAVGANQLRLCVDADDVLALRRVRLAVAQARELGLLGQRILGTPFCCEAAVCEVPRGLGGEEPSILLNFLEGKPARARVTPPSIETHGVQASPTVVESLETFALTAAIAREGAQWFAAIGAPEDPGTKLIALAGTFPRSGVIEVPTDVSLLRIVTEIGVSGNSLKAVQVGYPAGPWLPQSAQDVALDHEALRAAGCGVAADVLTAADVSECAVELARKAAVLAHTASCGQCTFGREGTRQLMDVLTDMVRGRALPGDIDLLLKLADGMKAGSLCANGGNATDSVLSALQHFRAEFESHVNAKQCTVSACDRAQPVGK